MRPPSYYASLASSNSRTSGPGYGHSSHSSSQLRSSFAAPSSSSYVTRTHLPYVSQSMLVAHCFTGPGSTTKPYSGSHNASSSSYLASSRPKSLKRYTPVTTTAYSSSSAAYTPSYSTYRSPATSSYTTSSSYYKPIRLRERPLLTQISSQVGGRTTAPTANNTTSRAPSRRDAAGLGDEDATRGWSSDVGRNISRNKYLIKFRELDKRAPSGQPIQLNNRAALEAPKPAAATEKHKEEEEKKTKVLAQLNKEEEAPAPLPPQPATPTLASVENLIQETTTTRRDKEKQQQLAPEVAATPIEVTKKKIEEPATTPTKPKVKRLVKPKAAPAARRQSAAATKDAAVERKVLAPKQEEEVAAPAANQAEAEVATSGGAVDKGKQRIRFRQFNLDDFNLLTVLGHGGWGFVVLAELKGHEACFAIKCIKKITIVEDDDFDSIMIERKVLGLGNIHPFICKLFCTFETQGYLFFAMEFCAGGDLMFHVQREGKFTEARCRFYAAEIICAIRFLHNRHIIYRDLKLDNILLDSRGHVRLVDFGMCQCRTYREEMLPSNFCGTPEYISPEIIKGVPYNHSVDWWSFGVLLYEMAVGKMPFRGSDENELLWNVCYEQIHYPMFLTKELAQLLQSLLEREPSKRMGMATCKAGDIYNQAWFRGTDWKAVEELRVEPPFVPEVSSRRDVRNFDTDFTESACELSPVDEATLAKIDQNQFQKFPYTNPDLFIFDT